MTKSKPWRPELVKRAPAKPFGIHRLTAIFQHDFESISMFAILGHPNATEGCFDGPLRLSAVGVTNDICQRFVDGENHGAAFRLRKSKRLRELPQCISHHAEHLRIAAQFHSE